MDRTESAAGTPPSSASSSPLPPQVQGSPLALSSSAATASVKKKKKTKKSSSAGKLSPVARWKGDVASSVAAGGSLTASRRHQRAQLPRTSSHRKQQQSKNAVILDEDIAEEFEDEQAEVEGEDEDDEGGERISWKEEETLFVHQPSDSLFCPLHKGLFVYPVITSCGHTFCKRCLLQEAAAKHESNNGNKASPPLASSSSAFRKGKIPIVPAPSSPSAPSSSRLISKAMPTKAGATSPSSSSPTAAITTNTPYPAKAMEGVKSGIGGGVEDNDEAANTAVMEVMCPECGEELDLHYLIPNLAIMGQISDLLVHCKYGCKQVHATTSAPSSSNNVDEENKSAAEQTTSLKLVSDEGGCKEKVKLGQKREHERTCLHAPVQCPFCENFFLRMNIDQHVKRCDRIPCPHKKAGCDYIARKDEVHVHLQQCPYEKIKGFIQKQEEQARVLMTHLQLQKKENYELREAVKRLTTKVDDLTHMLQLKPENCVAPIDTLPFLKTSGTKKTKSVASGIPPDEEVNTHIFKCKGTFMGHEGPVWSLAVTPTLLISGSSDQTIRVWDRATFKVRHTLTGHNGIVHAVIVVGKRLISGSSDKTIKVWNTKTMKCVQTITGHGNTICKLLVKDNFLFSGSYTEIKVWDVASFTCIQTLKGHNHWVRAMCVDGDYLYSGCYNLIKVRFLSASLFFIYL
ncbi:E3 ubiquitin-protein ligase traf7 [Balamuthia mandrillaris]